MNSRALVKDDCTQEYFIVDVDSLKGLTFSMFADHSLIPKMVKVENGEHNKMMHFIKIGGEYFGTFMHSFNSLQTGENELKDFIRESEETCVVSKKEFLAMQNQISYLTIQVNKLNERLEQLRGSSSLSHFDDDVSPKHSSYEVIQDLSFVVLQMVQVAPNLFLPVSLYCSVSKTYKLNSMKGIIFLFLNKFDRNFLMAKPIGFYDSKIQETFNSMISELDISFC